MCTQLHTLVRLASGRIHQRKELSSADRLCLPGLCAQRGNMQRLPGTTAHGSQWIPVCPQAGDRNSPWLSPSEKLCSQRPSPPPLLAVQCMMKMYKLQMLIFLPTFPHF